MPELPEVENVCRDIENLILPNSGKALFFTDLKLRTPKLRTNLELVHLKKALNKKVLSIRRRAKYILIELESGFLLSHLGMTGTWRQHIGDNFLPHDHVVFLMSDGCQMIYNDPRRFGLLEWIPRDEIDQNVWLKNLGPEPLSEEVFNADYLIKRLKLKRGPIKNLLMDQKIVVGLGNIYVNEGLYLSGISPQKSAMKLKKVQLVKLCAEIRKLLRSAIKQGGTTLRDYRRANGDPGAFSSALNVYGRQGEHCLTPGCRKKISATFLAGRSTFWCSGCQK